MDLTAIASVDGIKNFQALHGPSAVRHPYYTGALTAGTLTGTPAGQTGKADGTLFGAFLNSAIDNIRTTNDYLSKAEDEELKFAMGETENTHDLTTALQKASAALQYTVAVRDRLLDAYKELMQMQI